MKLLNKSLRYLLISLFFIIGIWSVIFYFRLLNEIKGSVDEGLENYKRQIVYLAQKDTNILRQHSFEEGFYAIKEIDSNYAFSFRDIYVDTLMYMQDNDDENMELEPVRQLTTAFERNGKYYKLTIINSMVEEDDLVQDLIWEAVGLYLVLILSIAFINNFVLQKLWKPFYLLLEKLKNFQLGKSEIPVVPTNVKEFEDLQIALKSLLINSNQTLEKQKEFIGNASHELQTPLAIAIHKLELILEKNKLDNEQAEQIAEILNIIERLTKLNKSLLLLTKIENNQFINNEDLILNDTFKQCLDEYEELLEYKNIQVELIENSELKLNIDPALAQIIASNLIKNAIVHNVENGILKIEFKDQQLIVSNSGKKVALDGTKIFDRFQKSNQEQGGSGLGLAILKAICNIYGYQVSYNFKNELHNFEITFR